MKTGRQGIHTDVPPSGEGCVARLAAGGWWLHLRRRADCSQIGCRDGSPNHAAELFHSTGRPIAASFELGETWFYDYQARKMVPGRRLAEPWWRPEDQPVPGAAGKAPDDWEYRFH